MGHGSPTEDASQARTRRDNAFFILDKSDSFSSIKLSFFAAISRVSRHAFLSSSPSNPLISSNVNPRVCALMYDTILLTLNGTPTDRAIIEHVKELATISSQCEDRALRRNAGQYRSVRLLRRSAFAHSRIVLLHVADGWAARTYGPDAVSSEITEDTAYLESVRLEFQALDIPAESELVFGEPDKEIIKWVREKSCDLVAMSTHGHRFLEDLFRGTTATKVRHSITVPILMLRAK